MFIFFVGNLDHQHINLKQHRDTVIKKVIIYDRENKYIFCEIAKWAAMYWSSYILLVLNKILKWIILLQRLIDNFITDL